MLRLTNLTRNDSGIYMFNTFRFQDANLKWKSDLPGVFLVVTGLEVKMTPSAVVTESQRVTLTCSTSCPLPANTTYIWHLNGEPVTPLSNQNKVLVLDPVRLRHAGYYSCAVVTPHNLNSSEKALTVQALGKSVPILNGIKMILLFGCAAILFCLWTR
ncbi:carcinoembryonic antigen-related cell adhesion molecule 6-like [Echeneis naucrates]|uniref:carcinoembryonic antigen-related cell adhesion molecule 6-like n=1 Tax=Echeneis naucrates TaxID=173247 RepID=UPI0011139AFA|nr:carcinoembryonic antigen-related cell adhesion molecule 6-like [Echeneis naucrates]